MVNIRQHEGAWEVRVERPGEKPQTYTCATEYMARQLATVFEKAAGRGTRAA